MQTFNSTEQHLKKGITNLAACFMAWSLSVNNVIYAMLCFVQNVLKGLTPYILN